MSLNHCTFGRLFALCFSTMLARLLFVALKLLDNNFTPPEKMFSRRCFGNTIQYYIIFHSNSNDKCLGNLFGHTTFSSLLQGRKMRIAQW